MSDHLSIPAEDPQGEGPQYTLEGLNHTLRIDGWSVIYEPEFGVWFDEYRHAYTAREIHEMIWNNHRVLPWTPEEAL